MASSSERVKFIYNAQFPSPNAIVLDYLLNNPHFTSREGRQKGVDAIAAFYRPLAEEAQEHLSDSEVQEIARHCVEVLAKQIDFLCHRYQLDNPLAMPTAAQPQSDLTQIERVLANGFEAIVAAIQSGAIAPASNSSSTGSSRSFESLLDLDQSLVMEGDELGELGLLLDDEQRDIAA